MSKQRSFRGSRGRGRMHGHGMYLGEKPRDFKGTLKKLLSFLKPYLPVLILVIILAVGSSVFSIVGPKFLGQATTKIYYGLVGKITAVPGAGIDFIYIRNIVLMLLALYVLSSLFAFIQGYIIAGIAQRLSFKLRQDISKKINRLPLKYFDNESYGGVLSRVTNDVDTISHTLNQSMSQVIGSLVTIIGVLVMMLSISLSLTLVALLTIPVSMVFISQIIKRSQKYFKDQQDYLGRVNGHVEEVYGAHLVVKAFNGEEKAVAEFDELNDSLYASAWKSQFLSGMMMPIMNFIGNLGFVAVSILGGWLAIKRTIEVGDILAFIQYVRQFNHPLMQVAQISNIIQATVAAAERVFEFLEEEEKVPEIVQSMDTRHITPKIRFRDVKFGYEPDKIIINNFNAEINPGQRIAIVGPTGAGKTTIVKLLMRFYELNNGEITIDGYNIKNFQRRDLRNMFGMVLQDTWLFNGTIKENIRYGRLEATDEEVIRAAKAAYAHSFIKTLPHGYDMVLNEEVSNISQGQKQLITIARAILADPKILILDEATSSVDTRTEVLIQRAMENLMKDRTSFIIAHRLSTIRNADIILVMNKGDIVEQGNHRELLARGGFYAALYNSQFETGNVC